MFLDRTLSPRLGDFGLACRLNDAVVLDEAPPNKWLAPEAIRDRNYSFKSDVWSLGITFIEMLTRKEPYAEIPLAQVIPFAFYDNIECVLFYYVGFVWSCITYIITNISNLFLLLLFCLLFFKRERKYRLLFYEWMNEANRSWGCKTSKNDHCFDHKARLQFWIIQYPAILDALRMSLIHDPALRATAYVLQVPYFYCFLFFSFFFYDLIRINNIFKKSIFGPPSNYNESSKGFFNGFILFNNNNN